MGDNQCVMKKLALLVLAFASMAHGQMFGGNLPPLGPNSTAADEAQFDLALSYLQPGNVARCQTIFWEVNWNPAQAPNYVGIDKAIRRMAIKRVQPLFLMIPCPYPTSPWYTPAHDDWWLPRRDVWPTIIQKNMEMAQHIDALWKTVSIDKRITPFYQLWNEPGKGKPGASNKTVFGEWSDDLHELLYKLAKGMQDGGIARSQMIGPAVSTLGENTYNTMGELLSCKPPTLYNWMNLVGYRAYHLRFGASWANGDVNEVKRAFKFNLDNLMWVDSKMEFPKVQKIMFTEWYVTPADCGVPINADMSAYHAVVFDLLKTSKISYYAAWGLRPGESDAPGNPWLTYGGVGPSYLKWLKTITPISGTKPTPTIKPVSGGG